MSEAALAAEHMDVLDQRRWGAAFFVVLAVHAGAAIAAMTTWSSRSPSAAPVPTINIDMQAMAPLVPPSDKAPGKEQDMARPPPPPTLKAPEMPRVAEAPDPDVAVPKEAEPEEERPDKTPPAVREPPRRERLPIRPKAARETTAPRAAEAPRGPEASAPVAGAARSNPAMVATWQQRLLGHLERFKRYPAEAQRRRAEGVVLVRFAIDRQGNVIYAALERSSGSEPLDAEGVAMLRRASPVPAPPDDIPGQRIEMTVPIRFHFR